MYESVMFMIAAVIAISYAKFGIKPVYRIIGRILKEKPLPGNMRVYRITALEGERVYRFSVVSPSFSNARQKAYHVCPGADMMVLEE